MVATPQPLSFEAFLAAYPEDGGIYELINGEIVAVNPAGKHEEVTAFIAAELTLQIRDQQLPYFLPRTCTVKPPLPNTAYKPDIAVLDRRAIAHEPLWEKSSTILSGTSLPVVIEVVSTNWRDDYAHKLADYEALGVYEYWIVDYLALGGRRYLGHPKLPTLTICQLVEGEYQLQQFRENDRINSPTFAGLALTANQVLRAGA
jgi:Uma2 family endonuclease